jgi:hypothetical protein
MNGVRSAGEGLLINGELPPVVFRQRRHYLDPGLKQLKGASSAHGRREEEAAVTGSPLPPF